MQALWHLSLVEHRVFPKIQSNHPSLLPWVSRGGKEDGWLQALTPLGRLTKAQSASPEHRSNTLGCWGPLGQRGPLGQMQGSAAEERQDLPARASISIFCSIYDCTKGEFLSWPFLLLII